VSVCLLVTFVSLAKNSLTDRDGVWLTLAWALRNHVLHGVDIPTGRDNLVVVQPTEKHWESAVVHTAKGIIQSSITSRHAMRPVVKIV